MSAPLKPHWTAARWCAVVGIAFVMQAGAVFLLSGKPAPVRSGDETGAPRFRMAIRTLPMLPAAEAASLAMAGTNDFSRTAWLARTNLTHRLSDWAGDAEWWRYPTNRLTGDFQALVESAGISRPEVREVPPVPRPVTEEDNTELALLHSTVELGGTLDAIGLRAPLAPPEIITAGVLPPTRVQVALNKDGLVLSALVVQGSGNADADAIALRVAAGAQFRAAADAAGPPRVGAMTFHWATIPPRTNAPAAP